jgi:hypothetical protein
MNFLKATFISLLLATSSVASAAPVLMTTDFINSAAYFNGFENIPVGGSIFYTGGSTPYSEGGITVRQIGGDAGNDIWTTLGGMEGSRSWYPNGGDSGYTDIRLTSGADFADISFLFRAYATGGLQYSLLNNGVQVLGGTLDSANSSLARAGFTGGGFDQLLLRTGVTGTFGDARHQALQLDSIDANAAAVPEPASLALFGLGLMGLVSLRRKQRK